MEHLAFCRDHALPVNDGWLFARSKAAAGAAAALDEAANAALPTAGALAALDGVAAAHPNDSIRICGTYPHMQWQGGRIEGFVVAQGCQVPHLSAASWNVAQIVPFRRRKLDPKEQIFSAIAARNLPPTQQPADACNCGAAAISQSPCIVHRTTDF